MNIYNIIKIFNKIRSTRLKLFTIYIMYIAKRRFLSLYVDPVIACNLRCQMCYFSSDNYKHEKLEKRILDINEFSLFAKSIFNRAIKVQIGCGAEPTLYSHLEELVKIAGDRIIVMPGCGITERNFPKLQEKIKAKEYHIYLPKEISSKMVYHPGHIYMGGLLRQSEFTITHTSSQRVIQVMGLL